MLYPCKKEIHYDTFLYCVKMQGECQSNILSSQSTGTSPQAIVSLRHKLDSVIWVQCDNPNCLKWRKLRKDTAKEISDDVSWTCEMNEDPHFSSCQVPEEDTYSYDKLAKKAKLDLIKSELRVGALVWAKVKGYCRWPAIVTEDPLNHLHGEWDNFEMISYHVEFLGNNRSHGWVRTNCIEVFGPGNVDRLPVKKSQNHKKTKKRKSIRATVTSKLNEKSSFKGLATVNEAIAEAMELLSLPCEERLKTCWFRTEEDLATHAEKIKKKSIKSVDKKTDEHKRSNRKRTISSLCLKSNIFEQMHNKENISFLASKDHVLNISNEQLPVMSEEHVSNQKLDLKCLEFKTSLLHSSKEEQFILDLQRYVNNEKVFEKDVTRFMLCNNLKLAPCPDWQNIGVTLFSLFLAVHERGGYWKVCEKHQWSSVYAEVSQQYNKYGGAKAKRFYKKNLYVYELYVKGMAYDELLIELISPNKKSSKLSSCFYENSTDCCINNSSLVSLEEDQEFDSPDVLKELNELDLILKSLENDESNENNDRVVPMVSCGANIGPSSPVLKAVTGSNFGEADEPEKAQVVPDLDFPSSVESSQFSEQEHVYHELQALQHEMDFIQDELNVI
ncbi:uncharacterized protein LOC106060765 isoform X2 [Biomphalaria glabrata]|uniref:Uncharacterized protein LOC106060765 isoform X2 n=1 Tax=Biomphalaria glabrata TaxID=6526 RepID=A0A9W3AKN1_BIOGL|nr:uncharacterized protein LOC106060765 isoform X2 [Biomphalaria glabrata]